MDMINAIRSFSTTVPDKINHITTEEATKMALIIPFLRILGYDIYNPTEVIPEFTADTGTKKGEKVDYAIKKDDQIIMLIECKRSGEELNINHASQLSRYFSVTETRISILTNGVIYQFYSDIEKPNIMDERPFFTFDLLNFQDHEINELTKFTNSKFSLDDILTTASKLKYTQAIKKILEEELTNPTDEFIKFFASQVYTGRLTKSVLGNFSAIVKEARKQFITEKINTHLSNSKLSDNDDDTKELEVAQDQKPESEIETTEEEIEGYTIVKAIVRQVVDVSRVTIRDFKGHCSVVLDDKTHKPICHFYFDSSQKQIGIFTNKEREKIKIDNMDDIFKYADRIINTVREYEAVQ